MKKDQKTRIGIYHKHDLPAIGSEIIVIHRTYRQDDTFCYSFGEGRFKEQDAKPMIMKVLGYTKTDESHVMDCNNYIKMKSDKGVPASYNTRDFAAGFLVYITRGGGCLIEEKEEFFARAINYADDLSHNRVTPPLRGQKLPLKYQPVSEQLRLDPKNRITLENFATLIGVSVKTLQRWDSAGILKAHRTIKGHRFYTYDQYLEYSKTNNNEGNKASNDEATGICYKPAAFACLVGVSIKTLQRWDEQKKLIAKRNPNNRRYYTDDQIIKAKELVRNKENPIDKSAEPPMIHAGKDKLSVGDAARMYSVSVRTMQRWDRDDILNAERTDNGRREYEASDVNHIERYKDSDKLSASEAAGIIGISQSTLWRWEQNGTLKGNKLPSGRKYYTWDQIRPYADKKAENNKKNRTRKIREEKKRITSQIGVA